MTETVTFFNTGATFDDDHGCPILGEDDTVTDATRFLYDFMNEKTWPSQAVNIANGSELISLVENGNPAMVVLLGASTMTYSGKGISAQSVSNTVYARVTLPDESKLPANAPGLLFTVWIRHKTSVLTSGVAAVAGYSYQTGAGNQYSLSYDFAAKTYNLRANGINHAIDASTWIDGKLVQLAVDWNSTDGVSNAYVNGALHDSVTAAGTIGNLKQPTSVNAGAFPGIFLLGGFSGLWLGEVVRLWLDESANTDHENKVSNDYSFNATSLK
ncbi:hypothetical protein RZQ47_05440 [Klebsiella variicola subsp. variicola]|uniref:hypothetical protein n=1 Tax=Klebsiella variicola TaxID=244366 RepID=UPI00292C9CEB|nr:hypothetical protein [Klebsiella variicola]MDV1441156.1 hypothetical protein [Klebsiella variicola subsp. variicola]MDZ9811955.1 hypothetical protein [Escherichia coli]HBW1385532.1 hypothetical protein [Klebsiella pneumoniae]